MIVVFVFVSCIRLQFGQKCHPFGSACRPDLVVGLFHSWLSSNIKWQSPLVTSEL
jgi:hypothetical protein